MQRLLERFHRLGLRRQVLLAIFTATCFGIMVLGVLVNLLILNKSDMAFREVISGVAAQQRATLVAAVAAGDLAQLQVQLNRWVDLGLAFHAEVLQGEHVVASASAASLFTTAPMDMAISLAAEPLPIALHLQVNSDLVLDFRRSIAWKTWALRLLAGIGLTALACLLLDRLLLQPILVLTAQARDINAGRLAAAERRAAQRPRVVELEEIFEALEALRLSLADELEQRKAIEVALMLEKQEKLGLRRQQQSAARANRAKSEFIAAMSHQLRTPMNGILGMAELLRDAPLSRDQCRSLGFIEQSGAALLAIVDDILDYSRIEAGTLQLDAVAFCLDDLLDDCLARLNRTMAQRHLELLGSIAPDTPRQLVGDPQRLQQIISTVLNNAANFTKEGYIHLRVSLLGNLRRASPVLQFTVTDTGVGMAPEVIRSLFDTFSPASGGSVGDYGGTGLGLALAKNLVQLMGGDMVVGSTAGSGTRVEFTAQLQCSEPQVAASITHLALGSGQLLLVSPNHALSRILLEQCEAWYLRCHSVTTGRDALVALNAASLEGHAITRVIIDHQLPDCSGRELASRLRQFYPSARLTLILLAGQASDGLGLLRDFDAVVPRPIALRPLHAALHGGPKPAGAPQPPAAPAPARTPRNKPSELKVLVAEDNTINRLVIEGLLNKLGIQPQFATNGREALTAVTSSTLGYDLILMDCEMPEMDGFEACRRIRQWETAQDYAPLTIIALTAHTGPELRQQVLASGMNEYLSKPIALDRLTEALVSLGFLTGAAASPSAAAPWSDTVSAEG